MKTSLKSVSPGELLSSIPVKRLEQKHAGIKRKRESFETFTVYPHYAFYRAFQPSLEEKDKTALENLAKTNPKVREKVMETHYFTPYFHELVWPVTFSSEDRRGISVIARDQARNQIIGFVVAHVKADNKGQFTRGGIDIVELNPDYIGKKQCLPFLEQVIPYLFAQFPQMKYIQITNVSNTGGGIPACLCYVRAGLNKRFKVFDKIGREVEPGDCTSPERNPHTTFVYAKERFW